jgi:hypothetical protein
VCREEGELFSSFCDQSIDIQKVFSEWLLNDAKMDNRKREGLAGRMGRWECLAETQKFTHVSFISIV